MAGSEFLFQQRPEVTPTIYAYSDTRFPGCLKVGYTTRTAEERISEQSGVKLPEASSHLEYVSSSMLDDGSFFDDHKVHDLLQKAGFLNVGGEWFRCTVKDVKLAVESIRLGSNTMVERTQTFEMRPEQIAAVNKTAHYYHTAEGLDYGSTPKFLWNCKMRFGKTFTAYQLAKKMGFKRVLVLTFKPAVVSAWEEDLLSHVDFEGWQFISRTSELTYETADHSRPIVCFGSFQDYLMADKDTGGIKTRNEWVHGINWDLVIFDEYHFGAWREKAKQLFEEDDEEHVEDGEPDYKYNPDNHLDESWLPITTFHYLFLSGTPFRALNSGEFIEEQIYTWSYSDEQRAKQSWDSSKGPNPYNGLPRMVLLTYRMPESIRRIAINSEYNEFDLNLFFKAERDLAGNYEFLYQEYVQKWLDLIRGAFNETIVDDLRAGIHKPKLPFSDSGLLNTLLHTLWFLPSVGSCHAMKALMQKPVNQFYHDYKVIVCAGAEAGIGAEALLPVRQAMEDPLKTKTITLTCGKLTTGVTVKPWTGIFMLRNLKTPETYFQSAFRVQSPWVVKDAYGKDVVLKEECYVFDFALDRVLRQIADYSCSLNVKSQNPETKVAEFINFLPVLAYDGSSMRQISATEILDIVTSGTSATLLAKRWESALLVNVDNDTLQRLMNNEQAMKALMSIEAFRSLNSDLEVIINKSEAVKKAKKNGEHLSKQQKEQLTEEEKEYKSKRKEVQDKLIKFATRIPIFMYLTDQREATLQDVITKFEPELFRKVTSLAVNDFQLLISLGLFNSILMNEAIYKFRRYEDSSLSYTGINMHGGEDIGLWDTIKSFDEKYMYMPISMIPNVESSNSESKTEKKHVVLDPFRVGAKIMNKDGVIGIVKTYNKERRTIKVIWANKKETQYSIDKAISCGSISPVKE